MITEKVLDAVSADINAAMKIIAENHGLSYNRGNITYTDHDFVFKGLKFTEKTASGGNLKHEQDFKDHAQLVGIKVEALGYTFTERGGDKLTVRGWNRSARKNKILLTGGNGENFHSSVAFLKGYLPTELLA